jgi:phospholipase/carboxylesterase
MLDGPRLAPASGGTPHSLVVLVHGYGSNGADLIALAPLIQPALPDAAFVAPNAPSTMRDMTGAYQWWPIRSFSESERAAGADGAAAPLDAFLDRELAAAGLTDDRLLLVGFSQGTMMALHVGLRRPKPLAGIIGFSGMLVAANRLAADIRSRPPILLIHGTADDVVPFRSLELAAASLWSAGVTAETHVSPGVGHTVGADGLAAATTFARQVLA